MRSSLLIILTYLIFVFGVAHIVVNQKLKNWIEQEENIIVETTNYNLLIGNLRDYVTYLILL